MGTLLSKVLLHERCVEVKRNIPMKSGGTDNTFKVIWIKEKEKRKETEEGREGKKDGKGMREGKRERKRESESE